MSTRIREHLHSNMIGYVALFFALSGGVAWATHPGGANTISTEDIINGQVKTADIGASEVQNADIGPNAIASGKVADDTLVGADVKESALSFNVLQARLTGGCPAGQAISSVNAAGNPTCVGSGGPPSGSAGGDLTGSYPNPDIRADRVSSPEVAPDSLTGADIDETGLDFECPGAQTEAGDVCFGAVQPTATWEAAADDCASQSLRLPSDGEARVVHAELGPPPAFRTLWTQDQQDVSVAMVSRMVSDGSTDVVGFAKTSAIAYVCVRAPVR